MSSISVRCNEMLQKLKKNVTWHIFDKFALMSRTVFDIHAEQC